MSWIRRRRLLLLLSLWLWLQVPTASSSSPARRLLLSSAVVAALRGATTTAFGNYYNYDCCCHRRRLHSSSSSFVVVVGRQRRVRPRSVGSTVDIETAAVVVQPPVDRRRRRRTRFLQMGMARSQDDVEGPVQALARVDNDVEAEHVQEDQERGVGVGLYLHLPFCRRRCRYCSFAVVPVGEDVQANNGGGRDRLMERYIQALVHEIRRGHEDPVEDSTRRRRRITSVYVGGGTPSLVPIPLLQQVMEAVHEVFEVASDAEITMEMDPGTFDASYLQDAVELLGVNRLSLGIQSLNSTILQHLGRQHTVEDAHRALELVRNVTASLPQQQHDDSDGLSSFSIDLISSVPGLSLAEWCHTLQTVVDQWNPPHISIYDLQIERGTVFGTWYGSNNDDNTNIKKSGAMGSSLSLPTDDESAYMYRYASAYLTARGYEHYEVSSYAKRKRSKPQSTEPDSSMPTSSASTAAPAVDAAIEPSILPYSYRSRHNQMYWDPDGSWYGFGMGATSYLNGRTVARPKTLHDYIEWVDQRGGSPAAVEDDYASVLEDHPTDTGTPNAALDLCESIVLKRLRTVDGLDLERDVAQRFGQDHVDAILHGAMLGIELGLAELDPISRVLRLTVPDGFLLSNSVLSSIFVALEELYER